MDMDKFETLKYDSKYCRLKHPARDGRGPYRGEEDDELYPEDPGDTTEEMESLDIEGMVEDSFFDDEDAESKLQKMKKKIEV